MTAADDDLRVQLGRIGGLSRGTKPKAFVAQVLAAAQRSGHAGRRSPSRSTFGRGRVAVWRTERWLLADRSRRVVVKARVVRHGPRVAPLRAHLRYLRREGVTKDGSPARMFEAAGDSADPAAFAQRCEGDRHHFRFTVSPEDAGEITDLRAFTRELTRDMERDLGTRLDWVAVDHWNTDNPHVHLIVRGKAEDGRDLVISRDYISRGMRARATELVTLELGPRPEHIIRNRLEHEVTAERGTQLDRAIARQAQGNDGIVDLRPGPDHHRGHRQIRTLVLGRLQRLERMGLARAVGPAQWLLAEAAEPTLRELGLRGDIVRTMHRALRGHGVGQAASGLAIHDACDRPSRLVGRVLAKGLQDELTGTAYLVVDGVDGRVHHVTLAGGAVDLERAPSVGGVVEVRSEPGGSSSRAQVRSLCDLPIERQVGASGATWLDHHLAGRAAGELAASGFGAEASRAVEARADQLVGIGLARRRGHRLVVAHDLLTTLERRDLASAAAVIAAETGLEARPAGPGESLSGVYRRRVDLVSGRFALLTNGRQFVLVPWVQALERDRGREIAPG